MVAKARALRDQGLTWREIGAEVHRSRRSVARWFAAAVEEGEA
jgi:orotate phosphoribosyltransferase-like protein